MWWISVVDIAQTINSRSFYYASGIYGNLDAAREAEARCQFYQELQFTLTPILLSDNQGALEISENPSKYQKIKHVDIRYHYIRHQITKYK